MIKYKLRDVFLILFMFVVHYDAAAQSNDVNYVDIISSPQANEKIIPALNKDQLNSFAKILVSNKYAIDTDDCDGDTVCIDFDPDDNTQAVSYNVYKGDFLNDKSIVYMLVHPGDVVKGTPSPFRDPDASEVRFFKLINNSQLLALNYQEVMQKNLSADQIAIFNPDMILPPMIVNGKTYLRYLYNPFYSNAQCTKDDYSPLMYDQNFKTPVPEVCSFLWKNNQLTTGPNHRFANNHVITFTGEPQVVDQADPISLAKIRDSLNSFMNYKNPEDSGLFDNERFPQPDLILAQLKLVLGQAKDKNSLQYLWLQNDVLLLLKKNNDITGCLVLAKNITSNPVFATSPLNLKKAVQFNIAQCEASTSSHTILLK